MNLKSTLLIMLAAEAGVVDLEANRQSLIAQSYSGRLKRFKKPGQTPPRAEFYQF